MWMQVIINLQHRQMAGLNIGDSEAVGSLSQVNASNNAITSFNCAGFVGILDLQK